LLDEIIGSRSGSDRTGAGRLLAVLPAAGGCGASVFAVALAVLAAQDGAPVVLVDAAPAAGGIDLLLGMEHAPGTRLEDLRDVRGRLDAPTLIDTLPSVAGVRVLSAGRREAAAANPAALLAAVDASRRAGAVTVVDLAAGSTDTSAAVLAECDRTVLVARSRVRAAAAAAMLASPLRGSAACLVVRTSPDDRLTARDVATAAGLGLVAGYASERAVARAADAGCLAAALRGTRLAAAARVVLDVEADRDVA